VCARELGVPSTPLSPSHLLRLLPSLPLLPLFLKATPLSLTFPFVCFGAFSFQPFKSPSACLWGMGG
jgi:hypothetical protein